MRGAFLSFFQLVLRILSKLIPNTIDKGLGIFEVFLEKNLEVRLCDQSDTLMAVLLLGPFETNGITEKYGGKKCSIYLYDA